MFRSTRTMLCAALLFSPSLALSQELDVEVTRGGEEVRDAVTAALSVASLLAGESATPQSLVAAAQADYTRIVSAMYADGRFGPEVSILIDGREAAEISPFEAPSNIRTIQVNVNPGPSFRFGRAEIRPLSDGTVLPEGFQTGERARTGEIRDAVAAGVTGWREAGHAKAQLTDQQVRADHPNRKLDVDIRLSPGPRLRFGDLTFTGNEDLSDTRMKEIAGIPQGEVYDPEAIDDAERRLRDTGVFKSVSVSEAETPNADDTLDLVVQVAEQKPRRFGIGAEVSTEEGATFEAYWLHRNLFQGAERLRVDAEVSGIGSDDDGVDYELEVLLGRPATFTPDTEFYVRAKIESLDEPGYTSDQASIGVGVFHRFSDTLEGTFGFGYRYIDTNDAFGDRVFELFAGLLAVEYDTRDDELDATQGFYLQATGTPFLSLADTDNGVRLTADARTYYGLGEDNRFVLAGRAQIGSVWGPSLEDTVPDYLFYSGGGGTVRGQDYESLGVETDDGDFTGGQSFAALSAELRAKVRGNIGLVGFYDYGIVTEDSGFSGGSDNHAGAGLGLRYDTGIGPIRVDIATPVNGDDAGQSFELYIGIGQAF